MYTLIISILILFSLYLYFTYHKKYDCKAFYYWFFTSCMVGWVEFVCFLRHDAWLFDHKHVIGLRILDVTIEDYIFCPCFSIIFWWLYDLTKKKFKQRVFNPDDKLLFTIGVFLIALIYYDIGSQFSKYMALRASIGFVGLIYCWNWASFRHCGIFLIIVYIIGFGWDLPSVVTKIWTYIDCTTGVPSKIYDGKVFAILGAKFPIELFGYYFTGGFFSFWTISFFRCYFERSYRK